MEMVSTKLIGNDPRGLAPYRAVVYCGCTLLVLFANYFLGKEMAWDMLNYHMYAGFSALNNRFSQDYFAAGPQSYFNPYAYVPFYGLARSSLSSLAISSILAAVHSVILWLTFELTVFICPSADARTRAMIGICSVALALSNPILIQQIGSSFADITTGELTLAGWVLLAGAVQTPRLWKAVAAGFLLGVATGLKLTNSVHAVAAVILLFFLPMTTGGKLKFAAQYCLMVALGFALVAAPWSYRLEPIFANPFFPLLNNLFHSPEFTTEPLRHLRFIPGTLAQALWRPFAMVDPVRRVHEELSAPDPRYAVLMVVACVVFSRYLWRRRTRETRTALRNEQAHSPRGLVAIACAFAADWVLWLAGSGNSRYFLPLSCVAAALLAASLFYVLRGQSKVRNYVLLALFASQAVQLYMGAEFRSNAVAWDDRWFNVAVPKTLATESSLILSIGMQSDSFIAPYLASGSGLINFSGSYTPLTPQGASGSRIAELIRRYSPHIRMLARGARIYEDAERRAPSRSQVNDKLARFGLRVDVNACEAIEVKGLPPELEIGQSTTAARDAKLRDTTYLVSCHVVRDDEARYALSARQQGADAILDRLEDSCPNLLQPKRAVTELDGEKWQRLYMNTDLKASVTNDKVTIRDSLRADSLIYMGAVSDWVRARPHIVCSRGAHGYVAYDLN